MTYVRTLKRIRLDKTNYRKRAAVIIGRHSFVTVKVTDQNVAVQMLKPTPTGDLVIASVHSHELAKQGWKGSSNSLPACYLAGLLLGKKAQAKGTNKGILYIGKDHFTTRVAACVKGIADSGLNIPVGEESFPDGDRISGQHIADYANALKADKDAYNSRFSALLKNGLKPEEYPAHFEEVRFKISGKAAEPKAPKKEKKAEEPAKEKKQKAPKREAKEDKRPDKGAKKK
ncbi:MAG: 50S ribosomal protein L18 [Nitrososphaera sp.]|uniref:50S ribosomal protein L18 n=1 Tax=Nitrososphaera sp. TaxID=1971748 RepID=UPI003D6E2DD1